MFRVVLRTGERELSEVPRRALHLKVVDLPTIGSRSHALRLRSLGYGGFVQNSSRDFSSNLPPMLEIVAYCVFCVSPEGGNVGLIPAAVSHVGRKPAKVSKTSVNFVGSAQ